MRKFLLFAPLGFFLVLSIVLFQQLGKDTQYMPSALIGKKIPDFSLVSLNDDQVTNQKQLPKGSYLLNFWGTWCTACHIEHPFLVELASRGIPIIGVNYRDEKVKAIKWLAEKSNPYRLVLMDELGNFGIDMGVTGAPETFVVNSDGIIVYRHQGPITEQNWKSIKGYLK